MDKLLTICVPTYNMEALLSRCLDSFILDPSYMNYLEVIVVNDGSKDLSSEIAHSYEVRFPNSIKVIDKENGNYGSCVNAALKVASGKYFKICDADDHFMKNNLQDFLDLLNRTDADIVFSPYKTVDFDGELKSEVSVPENYLGQEFSIDSIVWDSSELKPLRAMHCMATKTRLLLDYNYYQTEGISYTDMQFVFYSSLFANSVVFFNAPIYCYYLGRDGQTMSKSSMIRTYMHFYQNANRMLEEFLHTRLPVSKNKSYLLIMSIATELSFYISTILAYVKKSEDKIDLYRELITKSRLSHLTINLEEYIFPSVPYTLWKKYHIPPRLIYLLATIKSRVVD